MSYNLKIAFRNLKNNRFYTIISIAGLAVSMAVCSFILTWVQDEKSYDRFHSEADEIYQGVTHHLNDGLTQTHKGTTGLFAPEAKAHFTVVKSFCRVRNFKTGFVQSEGINTGEKEVLVADSTFFTFFNFPIVSGLSQGLLQKPDEVVISDNMAKELFGNDDPIGKTIMIKGITASYAETDRTYHVAAVMKNFPANTCLPHAELVIPQISEPQAFYLDLWNGWSSLEFLSFVRLKKGADTEQLAKDISNLQTWGSDFRYFSLQPLVNLHLYTLEGEPAGIKTVWIFIWIASAILVISCINYINLITGRSAKRNHEIGLKKVLGARKPSLFAQLMTEAVVLFLTALIAGVFLNVLFAGVFNQLSGKEIYFGWTNWNNWLMYGLMFVAVIILAGIYPALSLSSFKLMNMLQGKLTNKCNSLFRSSLVVFQFAASIVLIAATVTLESQLTYLRRKDLGYDKEQVFTCRMRDMAGHYQTVKTELTRNPFIQSVFGASDNLYDVGATNTTSKWEGKTGDGSVSYYRLFVDSSFFNNMAMTFAEGSGFMPDVREFAIGTGFETGDENQFVVNETAAKSMGFTEPVVGKWLEADHSRGRIVGVVKDFHFNSFYDKIAPLVIFYTSDWASTLYIRTTTKDAGKAITDVEKLWKAYNPNYTFDYRFMDESFEQLYRSYISTGRLFGVFSFIAILISCLGLFGLVTYTAESKTKEIGIRKVYGASITDIVTMLSKQFMILVALAMLIAFPLAYYWLDSLLQDFAYRITIGWWIFALSGVITIILTLLTVGRQALKAATANPVEAINHN